jgi:hypothetical protein
VGEGVTFYPGVGAEEAIAELHSLIGQITADWARIEDGLFTVFVLALVGSFPEDQLGPYRAVFFTFSSYEGKMRMVNNAMNARYGGNEKVKAEWRELRKALDDFARLRNEVAHLYPAAKSWTDPTAKANVRLVPPFWRSCSSAYDFDSFGYSVDELWQALPPYWGYHPRISLTHPTARLATISRTGFSNLQ